MARGIVPEAQEAMATARFIRISPTKARQVVDLIRGRHVDDARRVLRFTPRGPSVTVGKVLESAVANAEHNRGLPRDELVVARAWVDEGPTLKRFRPRALGRATRIRKRTCHISVVVARGSEAELAPAERPGTKEPARRGRKDTAGTRPTRSSGEPRGATSSGSSRAASGGRQKKSTTGAKKSPVEKTTTGAKKSPVEKTTTTTKNEKEGS